MTGSPERAIAYPDSDGQPMADNTLQFRWIVLLKENLEILFASDPQVFVAGDLLWYPVEGRPDIRTAPDVLVVFGRPKGDRGSYRQWQENDVAPQVVFEVLSPGNRLKEMTKKLQFYDRYGVEEYYLYDPDRNDLHGLQRVEGQLQAIDEMDGWTSPRLGIRFVLTPQTLVVYRPDGEVFLSPLELFQRANLAQQQAIAERQRADLAQQQALAERQRAEALAAQLRNLGIDPDTLN